MDGGEACGQAKALFGQQGDPAGVFHHLNRAQVWVGWMLGSNKITVGVEQKVSGQTDMFLQGVTASPPNSLIT